MEILVLICFGDSLTGNNSDHKIISGFAGVALRRK